MSLEFYAGIDNFKVDAKGNISITEKLAGSALKNKLNEARVEYAGMAKAWYEVKEDDDEE